MAKAKSKKSLASILDALLPDLASRYRALSPQTLAQLDAAVKNPVPEVKSLLVEKPGALVRAFSRLAQKNDLARLENVPDGFSIQLLVYTRRPGQEIQKKREEFRRCARRQFLRFLAENHAPVLRQIGIGLAGIKEMKKGKSPKAAKGKKLDLHIEHIHPLAGGGPNLAENFYLVAGAINNFSYQVVRRQTEKMQAQETRLVLALRPSESPKEGSYIHCPPSAAKNKDKKGRKKTAGKPYRIAA